MQIIEHINLICRKFHIQENNAFKDKEISDSFLFLLELVYLLPACVHKIITWEKTFACIYFIRILQYIITEFF